MSREGKNIYRGKNGQWEGRYKKGKANGKMQYGYVFGKTYEEVENRLKNARHLSVGEEGFDTISVSWLNSQKSQLKASSSSKYTNILNSYLIPKYGTQSIYEITRNDVTSFSRELLISGGENAQGLSPKTVNSIISVLKSIFEYASREKGLLIEDINGISVKQPQKSLRILSINEQQRLNRHLCSNPTPCHLGILLCLYTGLRIGEICALKWGDICIDEQYLFVHQSMQRIQTHDGSDKKTKIMILPPKSECSIRRIPIPNEMFQLLLDVRKQDEAYLLTGMVHSFIEPRSMENHFKIVAEECGIQNINFHALRHTFATRCIEVGFDIKSLSEILGHASVNITLNRYVHPSMELKQKNMNKLSDFFVTK